MIDGGFVYGELNARSTRFLAAWMSTSNEVIDRLKSTFQATFEIIVNIVLFCCGLTLRIYRCA